MTTWETPEDYAGASLTFVYFRFGSDNETSFDLDDELLNELVAFFVGVQLDFWKEINRIADFRFPNRTVPPYISQVEAFINRDQDGFIRLFGEYLVYFIFLSHIHSESQPCTQKQPHLKPSDHYADHIAAWPIEEGKYQIVFTEVKTTEQKARDLIRDKAFDEFRRIENGELDRDVKADVNGLDWYFIENEEQVQELVESLFWKRTGIYHACAVSTKFGPNIFAGYEDVAARDPDEPRRRWATVIPISDWKNWENIRTKAKRYIETIKERGQF